MNTKTIGECSEGMVLASLLRAKKVVLQPFGDNQRYDLVVDEKGTFLRIQCKTARIKNGCLLFDTCSSQCHRGKGKFNYRGQADLFAIYSPDFDKVYIVPVDEVGVGACRLRVDPPRNPSPNIRLAEKYEFKGSLPKVKR